VLEDLKARAKSLGLWNMFLPKNHFKEGAGFTNLEYGLMAEYLGKSFIGSEVFHSLCETPAHADSTDRRATAPLQTQGTWSCLPSTAQKRRSLNGWLHFLKVEFVQRS
jgi:hypothetical protein